MTREITFQEQIKNGIPNEFPPLPNYDTLVPRRATP